MSEQIVVVVAAQISLFLNFFRCFQATHSIFKGHSPSPCPPIDTVRKQQSVMLRSSQPSSQVCEQEAGGRSLTCNQTLAGITRGHGMDPVGRVRNLISSVLDGDGVTTRYVWNVGHGVCPVPVVPDVGLLEFSLWVLVWTGHLLLLAFCKHSTESNVENVNNKKGFSFKPVFTSF